MTTLSPLSSVWIVYGLLMGAFALIVLPFFLLAVIFAPSGEFGGAGSLFAVLFVFVYPIMGLVIGWISGALTAAIYNLVVRWTGGLLLEFDGEAGG